MACTLPHKKAIDNSKEFLINQGAIDENLNILDLDLFYEVNNFLERDAAKHYNTNGPLWEPNLLMNMAEPNSIVLNTIDEVRKRKGIYEDRIASNQHKSEIIPPSNMVDFSLKVVNALQSDKVRNPNKNIEGFYNDLKRQGISDQQLDIVKEIVGKGVSTKADIISEILSQYTYTVEINTATRINSYYVSPKGEEWGVFDSKNTLINTFSDLDEAHKAKDVLNNTKVDYISTSYYSQLTVPGGANYTENEIRTVGITPSITGHAQFSTKEGIGWFRSDIKADGRVEIEQKPSWSSTGGKAVKKEGILTKTRRILEVQSDLFQKGRDREDLITSVGDTRRIDEFEIFYSEKDGKYFYSDLETNEKTEITKEQYENARNKNKNSTENQFLQLLNKDNNWVTFFVKSIIQDSAKRGYENILFPTGDTASKIEGHQTLEEFKKEKERRLEKTEAIIFNLQKDYDKGYIQDQGGTYEKKGNRYFFVNDFPVNMSRDQRTEEVSKAQFDKAFDENISPLLIEREAFKEEIKRVETEGLAALAPIYKFYEETVRNILKKQGYNPTLITDEHGNTWNEISIDRSRDLTDVMLQLASKKSKEITPELKSQLIAFARKLNPDFRIEVLDDLIETKGANGIAKLSEFLIQLQAGKEGALPEEIAHFFVEALPEDHPLKQRMYDEVPRTKLYKQVVNDYSKLYGNDVQRLKRETAAKLIALYLADRDMFNYYTGTQSLIDNIVRWIKDLFRWIMGKKKTFGSFMEAADKIIKLDTSDLLASRLADMNDMYSLGDYTTEATNLSTVGGKNGLNTRAFETIYINIADTILDVAGYDFGEKTKKDVLLDKALIDDREKFYKNAALTNLGKELKDKIKSIGPEKIILFSKMFREPALIERMVTEFGIPVENIRQVNIQSVLEDEHGNIKGQTEINKLEDMLKEDTSSFVVIDNDRLKFEDKEFNPRMYLYADRYAKEYEPFMDRIERKRLTEENKKKIDNLTKELKSLDEDSMSGRVEEAFNSIKRDTGNIERLEHRLKNMGIDLNDYFSTFRNEGGELLLPMDKASQMRKLLKELNNYESSLKEYIGVMEAVRNFFKTRNDTNFETLRKLVDTNEDAKIDVAIQELAQITKMGALWQEYIESVRELISDTPNTSSFNNLLGEMNAEISKTRNIARSIAKTALSERLAKEFAMYNYKTDTAIAEVKKQMSESTDEREKERLQQRLDTLNSETVGPEDLLDIFNGKRKDIDPITVWVKTLHNSSDPLLGAVNRTIQRAFGEVDVETVSKGQELGEQVQQVQQEYNITDEEYQEALVVTGKTLVYEGKGEDRKKEEKDRWELLNPFVNFHHMEQRLDKFLEVRKKWWDAKDNKEPAEKVEELRRAYMKEKKDFDEWKNKNWHQQYTQEYLERLNNLAKTPEDEALLEEISLEQQQIYNQILDISRESLFTLSTEDLKEQNNRINLLRRELKEMKRLVDIGGNPKQGKDLRKAELLKEKSDIDQKYHEYVSNKAKFRGDFLNFLASIEMSDIVRQNLTNLVSQDKNSYSDLYKEAVSTAPIQVKQWLDLNTIIQIDPEWYEERKVITDRISEISKELAEITGVDISENLNEIWQDLFNLTSPLRDENGIFDGSDSTPEIQEKVKELEEVIERIKEEARSETKPVFETPEELKYYNSLKSELRDLIDDLSDIQSKDVTDAYLDYFVEYGEDTGFYDDFNAAHGTTFEIGVNTNPKVIYSSNEFKQFIKDNPDHPFIQWFNRNHLTKVKYNELNEKIYVTEPTYIWFKIQPTDSERIWTVPSFKYSQRKVKDAYIVEKVENENWSPVLGWLPKSKEYFNPKYLQLASASDRKSVGLFKILRLITNFHLSTQKDTSVAEGKIGYGLPYVQKQGIEKYNLKAGFNDFINRNNRFEEGEGNFDETGGSELSVKDKIKAWYNTNIENIEKNEEESNVKSFRRVAVPYTTYVKPSSVTKDILLSTIMYSASTHKADRMLKNLSLFTLIEDSLENPPKVDKRGRVKNVNSNRSAALKFSRDHYIHGVNKQYELGTNTGKTVDQILVVLRKLNTFGALGLPAGVTNIMKNNLQGRFQNIIGSRFGNWSSNASMRRAAMDFSTNYFKFLAEAERPLDKRSIDFHIIAFFDPALDSNIYDNLLKGASKRVANKENFMMANNAMEFSIASNLLYSHLYFVKVKNQAGEEKTLRDILEFKNGKLQPMEGWVTVKEGRPVDESYLMDTKLAYKTVAEYVQGRITEKTLLSTTTIGQAILYFKSWLIPMLRRRFDRKRANYMIGENVEGYWKTFLRLSLIMLKEYINHGKTYYNTFSEEERRNYETTLKEMTFMLLSLIIVVGFLGFDPDDPEKFNKLKNNSYAENLAILLAVQAKNETEALSLMPFVNMEMSAVPTVLTEGVKWITNPTIGLAIIDNTWKTINYTWALVVNQDNALYTRDMPQFGIEKGDYKFFHYLKKIFQIDDFMYQAAPEDKLRIVLANIKR